MKVELLLEIINDAIPRASYAFSEAETIFVGENNVDDIIVISDCCTFKSFKQACKLDAVVSFLFFEN